MMDDDGRKLKRVGKNMFYLKTAGDHLGTLVGVPIAPQKINPTEAATFSTKKQIL